MIDTIKVAIPLTKGQHRKVMDSALEKQGWQWARVNPSEGEIQFQRIKGLAEADQESYHRELRYDIQPQWGKDSRLILEFSIPKYWQGHNIHLLYGWFDALKELRAGLQKQFKLKWMPLPDPKTWEVLRIDCCYAWRFLSQQQAQAYLESLKILRFPYKTPIIYRDSILFPGETYSAKAYLKKPEFFHHDRKELIKQNCALEWVNHLEKIAEGVLRFEVTCRRKYLLRRGLRTVADFMEDKVHVIWDEKCRNLSEKERGYFMLCLFYWLSIQDDDKSKILLEAFRTNNFEEIESGMYINLPSKTYILPSQTKADTIFDHKGGGFRLYRHGQPLSIIQENIKKFVGEGIMHSDNQVRQMLMEVYKPNKAARLTGFWTYVQRFGLESAKETFGKNPFYEARRDLKAVGIDLIERPDNVTFLEDNFFRSYRMRAPSESVVNAFDNFREGTNLLNFPKEA
jgi:hypothetical protein